MIDFILEIGGNHEGDFNYAKKLILNAVKTKANIIKTQIYKGDTLVNKLYSPQRNKHFKKFELSFEQHIELAKIISGEGKLYSTSIWDINLIDKIDKYVDIYKIGSGDLTSYQIISELLKTSKPIVLSTGLANLNDVKNTIEFIYSQNSYYRNNPNKLTILQCTSMYPIDYESANLNVINTFKKTFENHKIGYSDHTIGTKALKIAIARDVDCLEFHFTDDKSREFRDHKVSLDNKEVDDIVDFYIDFKKIVGNGNKEIMNIEIESGHDISFRRAVFLNKDVKRDHIITSKDLICLRPNLGISAEKIFSLIGKSTNRPIKKLEKLHESYFK